MSHHAFSRRQFLLSVGSATSLAGSRWSPLVRRLEDPDLLFLNGDIHLLDAADTKVEAVALGGGRVLAAGSSSTIQRLRGARTRLIDLRGRTALPGINDSHLHAVDWGFTQPPFSIDVGYPKVRSIAEAADAVRKAVVGRKPGDWIVGRGWDQPYFAEGRAPTRADLDIVASDHPVVLTEFSGHAVWVNTRALQLAGVTRESTPPPGGVIVRDSGGEPTGVLHEGAADLIWRILPLPSAAERARAVDVAAGLMTSMGITSFTDPGADPEMVAAYAAMARDGQLPVRATVLLDGGHSVASLQRMLAAWRPLDGLSPRRMRVAGVKLYADGIPTGNKTALLHEPYQTGGNGSLTIEGATPEDRARDLREMIRLAHGAGFQIGTHATGDAAIDLVVEGYLAAQAKHPREDPRHSVIHADLVSPATLRTMAGAGIGANFNAAIKYLIADGQMESIGPARAPYEWPYRTALDAGVVVASGSDAPVTDGDWRQGVATCVLREGKQTHKVSGADQRISLFEALRTYTVGGAWQDRAETWKGTLTVGMAADLFVLEARLRDIDLHDLPKVGVAMTVIDGRVVFER